LRQSGARKEGRDLVTLMMALVSVKIGVFWEVALLLGRLVDIDVSEEHPASMLWVEGALSEQKNKRNLSHSRLFM
jgi:hypothetical protein